MTGHLAEEPIEDDIHVLHILHHHRVRSQALGQAVKWDMLSQNVATRITPPKRTKPGLRILTFAEVRRPIDAAWGTDYFLPIYLALHTGLRRFEICGLRWSDVDLEAHALKGGPDDDFTEERPGSYFPAEVAEVPKSRGYRCGGCPDSEGTAGRTVFPTGVWDSQVCARYSGGIIRPVALSHGYKTTAEGHGITGVRFHYLRHSHASLLLTSNIPIHVVQARMGHEGIQKTVDTYGYVLPASDIEAGKIMESNLAVPFAKRGFPA